jgi:hypothetical protein
VVIAILLTVLGLVLITDTVRHIVLVWAGPYNPAGDRARPSST